MSSLTLTTTNPMIELDGTTLEGGGQLLRNAVALSALTRTPVRIPNVRQNRDQPGLKAQHAAVEVGVHFREQSVVVPIRHRSIVMVWPVWSFGSVAGDTVASCKEPRVIQTQHRGPDALVSLPLTASAVHSHASRVLRNYSNAHSPSTGLALVAQISNANAEGIEKGSQCVSFDPTREESYIRAGKYEADPGTAGSTTLLLQVSLPCLLFAQQPPEVDQGEEISEDDNPALAISTLTLRGGTNALNAPQADYAQHVLFPFLTTHILPPSSSSHLRLDIKQRGFYPHGGGLLHTSIPSLSRSQTLRSVELTDQGHVTHVRGTIAVSGVIGKRVAFEMRDAALLELFASLSSSSSPRPLTHDQITITIESNPSGRAGSSIILLAYTSTGCILAGSALGSKGTRASQTGQQAAQELVRHIEEGGCVDSWMQDQMIIFLALAKGRSVVRTGRITLHTRTAIWVAEHLTGAKFEVKENIDGTEQSLIICEGIGLEGRL